MISIVCGGRDYTDAARVRAVLDAAVTRRGLHTVIEGECPTDINADKLARDWALSRGDVGVIAVPGWKDASGRFCGPERNAMMLAILQGGGPGTVRAVIAFKGGNGTANMIAQARGAGVEVFEV